MSIVEKIKSFWLGAEETYDEGFDELFRLEGGLGSSSIRTNSSFSTPQTKSIKR